MAYLSCEGGYVCLRGPPVDLAARPTISEDHHILLFTQQEIVEHNIDALQFVQLHSTDLRFVDLGKGGHDGVCFEVILWPGGAQARESHCLPLRNFHIMLSHRDDPSMDKGPNSVR
eukprot:c41126_g1_i1 orf=2-346(-)